jgi:hypothetical protein
MSYFRTPTITIAEIGAHGDMSLEGEEYMRSDRGRRISDAADSLCDFVHEHIVETRGDYIRFTRFTQDDLNMIASMIAIGMMAQYEHDFEAECRYLDKIEKEVTRTVSARRTDKF